MGFLGGKECKRDSKKRREKEREYVCVCVCVCESDILQCVWALRILLALLSILLSFSVPRKNPNRRHIYGGRRLDQIGGKVPCGTQKCERSSTRRVNECNLESKRRVLYIVYFGLKCLQVLLVVESSKTAKRQFSIAFENENSYSSLFFHLLPTDTEPSANNSGNVIHSQILEPSQVLSYSIIVGQ